MVVTTFSPCAGGLEIAVRTEILTCDKTLAAVSASADTTVNTPTRSLYKPKFFENELAINISLLYLAIVRTPKASSSIPLPKPW